MDVARGRQKKYWVLTVVAGSIGVCRKRARVRRQLIAGGQINLVLV